MRNSSKHANGISRRETLCLGGLGAVSLLDRWPFGLPKAAANSRSVQSGRAKSVVFILLYGGPPQTETFDMKPEGPDEARGPFRPIDTTVPGIQICELLPKLSKLADSYTLVRSVSHADAAHAAALYTHITGWVHPRPNSNSPASPTDAPHYGSVMGKLRAPEKPVPPCVILGGRILPQFQGIGQTGGYLGMAHAPYVAPQGDAIINHYGTHLSAGHGPELSLPSDISPARLNQRRQILHRLELASVSDGVQNRNSGFTRVQQRAFDMISGLEMAAALEVERESPEVREAYGRHPLGDNLLLARRLVEAGVPTIQVSDIPPNREQHWDLHYKNIFDRLKGELLPRLDQSVSAFLDDLRQRGLLDQTLVIVGGEFGRTPWMDPVDGGRQHWPHCYSMLLAGGGVRGGTVLGSSDRSAAYPTSHRVTPGDLGATLLHLAGFDPRAELFDPFQNRPRPVCEGTVIEELL